MKLDVSGQPLHTRSLSMTTRQREAGRQSLDASVIDLRKFGFVPVAGMMQTSGIVHQMSLEGVIDPSSRMLERLSGAQQTPAFEPSTFTRGESCRDPLPRLEKLSGERLDDAFVARLRAVFGGALGCSHLLHLAQLAASGVATALDWDAAQPTEQTQRRTGERVFHRAVEIDGFGREDQVVQVSCLLSDFNFRASSEIAAPMARFGAQAEVRVLATIDVANGVAIRELQAWERRRGYADFETAEWRDRGSELEALAGQNVLAGMSPRLLVAFGDAPDDRALLDALLSVSPGFLQCAAPFSSERWGVEARQVPTLMGVNGRMDSCYMWRSGGALRQIFEEESGEGCEPPSRGDPRAPDLQP